MYKFMYTSNISVLLPSIMCGHLVSTDVVYEHRLYTDNNTDDIGGQTQFTGMENINFTDRFRGNLY